MDTSEILAQPELLKALTVESHEWLDYTQQADKLRSLRKQKPIAPLDMSECPF